ncbi:transcription activator of gluconeogenesis Ert1p [Trichomonascus vanleenenianus]|uniref:transcription activator of gluconeogenesis Ert1p n=1 Tax=Trichomonascus vanleenenianus TaxID=2268995 RepID=UPI003ECB5B4D
MTVPTAVKEAIKTESEVVISPRTGKPKRRKANRACVHCQRTHLTCDNNRPCERCVMRGLADTCRDGTRKKAKYLQDVPDSLASAGTLSAEAAAAAAAAANRRRGRAKSKLKQEHNASSLPPQPAKQPQQRAVPIPGPVPSYQQPGMHSYGFSNNYTLAPSTPNTNVNNNPHQIGTLDPNNTLIQDPTSTHHRHSTGSSFQSSAITHEYRIISNILHGHSPGHASVVESSPSISDASPPAIPDASNQLNHYTLGEQNLTDVLSSMGFDSSPSQSISDASWLNDNTPKRPISFAITDNPTSGREGFGVMADVAPFASHEPNWRRLKEPADIYRYIRRPYSYTPAYHGLIAYLRSRFQKEQLMKMARCMARYRPSFIACTNTLQEDDLIFMEQCFQRTLMEYEKFISYSGTPTIVWRRTGQVTAVGKEFCILTGWSRERLLDRQTFIVELMDDNSVLEYFEMFSNIAFGDSRGAMMSECTLLTPQGKRIKTASMWTLKRDVFGIPMMIIGNFLPILA